MKRKNVKIYAMPTSSGKPYVIAPVGLYCNRELRDLQPGDILLLMDGWRSEECMLERIITIDTNTRIFKFLIQSLYGNNMNAQKIFAHWDAQNVALGIGSGMFSQDEVALLEVRKIITINGDNR